MDNSSDNPNPRNPFRASHQVPLVLLGFPAALDGTRFSLPTNTHYIVQVFRSDGLPLVPDEAHFALTRASRQALMLALDFKKLQAPEAQWNFKLDRRTQAASQDLEFQAVMRRLNLPPTSPIED